MPQVQCRRTSTPAIRPRRTPPPKDPPLNPGIACLPSIASRPPSRRLRLDGRRAVPELWRWRLDGRSSRGVASRHGSMLTGPYAEFVALQIDLGPTPLVDTGPAATASRASRLLAMSGVHPSHDGRIV